MNRQRPTWSWMKFTTEAGTCASVTYGSSSSSAWPVSLTSTWTNTFVGFFKFNSVRRESGWLRLRVEDERGRPVELDVFLLLGTPRRRELRAGTRAGQVSHRQRIGPGARQRQPRQRQHRVAPAGVDRGRVLERVARLGTAAVPPRPDPREVVRLGQPRFEVGAQLAAASPSAASPEWLAASASKSASLPESGRACAERFAIAIASRQSRRATASSARARATYQYQPSNAAVHPGPFALERVLAAPAHARVSRARR
jgi:hypothetical protein